MLIAIGGLARKIVLYQDSWGKPHTLVCVNLGYPKAQNKPHLLRCGKTQELFDIEKCPL